MSLTCRRPPPSTFSGRTARTAPCASLTTISAATSFPVTSVSPMFTRKPVLAKTGMSVRVVPAPPAAEGGAGTTLTLIPVFASTGFRVNIGLTEVTGNDVAAEIVVKDAHGAVRAVLPENVLGGGLLQVNDITRPPASRLTPRIASKCASSRE